jgi:hypothetical protein
MAKLRTSGVALVVSVVECGAFGCAGSDNQVNAYGSASFFVSNDHSGKLEITDTTIRNDTGGQCNVLHGISRPEDTARSIENSVIE